MAMRQNHAIFSTLEILEGRRLMSTSVFLGVDCSPHGTAPSATNSPVEGNGEAEVDNDGHGKSDQDPTPAFPPIASVIPQLTGRWTGSQIKSDRSVGAELSLVVSSP